MIGSIISGGLKISNEHEEYRWASPMESAGLKKTDYCNEYFNMYLQGLTSAENNIKD
jgi:hypothetical protein